MTVLEWFDFDHQKYGGFKDQLDDLVIRDDLATYMKNRLLVKTPEEKILPALDFEKDPRGQDHVEAPETLFHYFLDHLVQINPILDATLTNLRELKSDQSLVQDHHYLFNLGNIILPELSVRLYDHNYGGEIERYNLAVLEILRGGKDHYDPRDFSDEEVERQLLHNFRESRCDDLAPDVNSKASTWLVSYINHSESSHKVFAGYILFEIDYNNGFQVLSSLADHMKDDPVFFEIPAWLTTGSDNSQDLAKKIMDVVDESQAVVIRKSLEGKTSGSGVLGLMRALDGIAVQKGYQSYTNLNTRSGKDMLVEGK